MAIEPLCGAKPEPFLAAAARALKPEGQFVLLEMVADRPLDPVDPMVASWARLEQRPAEVPSELEITNILARLRFDVRIVEDVSHRHMQSAIHGWRVAVQALARGHPSMAQIAVVVREAEPWLARFRLMRMGRLRLVRWHAIGGG